MDKTQELQLKTLEIKLTVAKGEKKRVLEAKIKEFKEKFGSKKKLDVQRPKPKNIKPLVEERKKTERVGKDITDFIEEIKEEPKVEERVEEIKVEEKEKEPIFELTEEDLVKPEDVKEKEEEPKVELTEEDLVKPEDVKEKKEEVVSKNAFELKKDGTEKKSTFQLLRGVEEKEEEPKVEEKKKKRGRPKKKK
jgi:hypothetical protein